MATGDAEYKVSVSRYALNAKIPYGAPFWKRFNGSFDNRMITVTALLEAIYRGQAITTWHGNNWRTSDNFICGQHIGLDFDTCDERSTLRYLINDKFIGRYAALAYTTISHTDAEPRARVIFLLDTPIQQAKNYTLAAAALLWVFGSADRQCKDAVRFFYGSPGCQFEYLNSTLPLDTVKQLIRQYQETGMTEKRQALKSGYSAPASQQEVADALKYINPWAIDYDEWLAVLMGIHAQFGDGGYSLAESWAAGKQGEVAQKWRSFHGQEDGVTIASVFAIAKRFGWAR